MIDREALLKSGIELEEAGLTGTSPSSSKEQFMDIEKALVGDYERVINKQFMLGVGAGWWKILLEGFDRIEAILKEVPDTFIAILQVKEKFGGLRVYTDLRRSNGDRLDWGEHEELHNRVGIVIEEMEYKAAITCEMCGEPGESRGGGWIKTLCDKHEKIREAQRKYTY